MLEKIIDLFNKSGKNKIEFRPGIKIIMDTEPTVLWINRMFKIRDNYMIEVHSKGDSMNMNINSIDNNYLEKLSIHLQRLYSVGKK